MNVLDVESVDLAELVSRLARLVEPDARIGLLIGRTAFRDAVVEILVCSSLEAEQVVDTLVARNYLVYGDGKWRVRPQAA